MGGATSAQMPGRSGVLRKGSDDALEKANALVSVVLGARGGGVPLELQGQAVPALAEHVEDVVDDSLCRP